MSKKLNIRLESDNKEYPPINLEVVIDDYIAKLIQQTPVTRTTFQIFESHFITPKAKKTELDHFREG